MLVDWNLLICNKGFSLTKENTIRQCKTVTQESKQRESIHLDSQGRTGIGFKSL